MRVGGRCRSENAGQAEVDRGCSRLSVHLLQLDEGCGVADLEGFDFAEPVVLLGFVDAVGEVGDDVAEPVDLGGIGA